MTRNELTPHRKKLYVWMGMFFEDKHRMPTHREIIQAGFAGSTSVVSYHLNILVEAGYLESELIGKQTHYKIAHATVILPGIVMDFIKELGMGGVQREINDLPQLP